MRLDSHQHFWKYNSTDYVWLSDEMDVLRRDHMPEELEMQLNRIGFDGTIAVQARQLIEETNWLLEDLLLKPPHIRPAIELVRQFPDQPFVLDHIAKPAIADRETSPWQEDIRGLAEYPHVFCKLAGMVTEAKWRAWEPEEFYPYLEVVLDAFGHDRVMIGSDWPVCTLSADYVSTMRIVLDFLEPDPQEVREAILGGNCARFYSIN